MKNITLTPTIQQTATQIQAYLAQRPSAADTVEGIHQFWISSFEPVEVTTAALEFLEEQGTLQQLQIGNRLVWRKLR